MDLSFSNQFGKAAASPPVNMEFTRIDYFSSRRNAANHCRNGAFLPDTGDESKTMNKDEVGIYPAASAIGKPCSDINGLPDLPEYLRGMENRGRND